jgi:DNA uptake protein ComE-like DNA-binding protein
MTEEIADAILDWLDEDDDTREFGAETEFYSGLSPPYGPTNGTPATVEELLLVRGVTPSLLFGLDLNRNGFADPHETGGALPEGIESDGSFDRGWAGMLTLVSAERNIRADGTPRINLNDDDLETLYSDLQASPQAAMASFIVAHRQNGPYTGSGQVSLAPPPTPNFTKAGSYKFQSILDLAGAKTSVVNNGNVQVLASPIDTDPFALGAILPDLFDELTTTTATTIKGRINLNQASREVLLTVPGLTEEQVDQILSSRFPEPTGEVPGSEYPTWLLSQAIVTLDEMKALLPYLTCRGAVYRAQVIGYYEEHGPPARMEVLIDTTSGTPRQLLWKELTHLGRGFSPGTLGVGGI